MNAAASPGASQTVLKALKQARLNAVQTAEQIAKARTSSEVRAVLDGLLSLHQAGGLTQEEFHRLTALGEARALDFSVSEGLARAASTDEARQLLTLIDAAPEHTEDAMLRKRDAIKRVLLRSGELELAQAVTVRLADGFTGSLNTAQYRAANADDTREIQDRLRATASDRLAAIRRARRRFVLLSLAVLSLGPLFTAQITLPIRRSDEIQIKNMLDIPGLSFSRQFTYSTRDIRGVVWYATTRHLFLMAAVPLFIAGILLSNRVRHGNPAREEARSFGRIRRVAVALRRRMPGSASSINWESALRSNAMSKLFAITAWAWLLTVILTHP